jgi:hypothetical protein
MKAHYMSELRLVHDKQVSNLMIYGSLMAFVYSVMRACDHYFQGMPGSMIVHASFPLTACIFGFLFHIFYFLKSPKSLLGKFFHQLCRYHGSLIINFFITILNTETNIYDSPLEFRFNFE